jgi:hypothetical protein
MKHQCQQSPEYTKAFRIAIQSERGLQGTFLVYESFATEEDVRAKEAAKIGEKIAHVSLQISYCPFCGEHLSA